MFHVMWNRPLSETDLWVQLLRLLRETLPPGWAAEEELEPRASSRARWRPDAVLKIRSPDGKEATLVVEAKTQLEPKDVSQTLEQVRQYASQIGAEQAIIVAPYLSPRSRERLTEEGAGFADATGNWRLFLSRPGLFIERDGADSNPWPEERPLRSLKGPGAGRVVRALCDFRPPYGIRELAERSNASLASVARVVEFLDREAILQREPRGPVLAVDWAALLRRWTQDYSFTRSNKTRTYLEARGLPALRSKLGGVTQRIAVTGSLAASELAQSVAPPRLATIYVDSVLDGARTLQLREAESGGNVILAEPFDDVVFDRTQARDGITFCNASQVAADLMTGPGRAPTEGEALIEWMKVNEDGWRS